jgi:hypothetical protein
MLTVRAATADDVEPLAELLAQACVVDPVVAWLIGDHALRYLTMHQFFTAELDRRRGRALRRGRDLVSAPGRPGARGGASAAQVAVLR